MCRMLTISLAVVLSLRLQALNSCYSLKCRDSRFLGEVHVDPVDCLRVFIGVDYISFVFLKGDIIFCNHDSGSRRSTLLSLWITSIMSHKKNEKVVVGFIAEIMSSSYPLLMVTWKLFWAEGHLTSDKMIVFPEDVNCMTELDYCWTLSTLSFLLDVSYFGKWTWSLTKCLMLYLRNFAGKLLTVVTQNQRLHVTLLHSIGFVNVT